MINEPQTPINALATQLLAALDADDFDIIDALTALRDLMTPPAFAELTLSIEFCPIHLCDAQICLDDETHDPYS